MAVTKQWKYECGNGHGSNNDEDALIFFFCKACLDDILR